MSVIEILPETVANKISAGEVVQRPASVVKELLENAVDAGADSITLIIKDAGKTLVQVIDNGCGMTEDDAVRCFERFATSKVRSFEDLENLHTLGFRGEALASIAAVSQVELKTKRAEDRTATLIRIEGGKFEEKSKAQSADGTSISVRNVFYNVPARRKFLKTNATEFKHIFEIIQALALSHTDIGWTFISDDEEVFKLTSPNLAERLNGLLGKDFANGLAAISETNDFMSVKGYLGKPAMMKRTKNENFLFINRRITQSKSLTHAVVQGYGELMGEREYPFFLLDISIDPSRIDVNVHPTKMEVKFDDDRNVYNMILAIVKRAVGQTDFAPVVSLGEKSGVPENRSLQNTVSFAGIDKRLGYNDRDAELQSTNRLFADYKENRFSGKYESADNAGGYDLQNRSNGGSENIETLSRNFAEATRDASSDYQSGQSGQSEQSGYLDQPAQPEPVGISSQPALQGNVVMASGGGEDRSERRQDERFIWQLHNKYILTQLKSGLMMIDQHVAHERILYERALSVMASNVPNSQQLLFPQKIELKPWEYEIMETIKSDLERLGFSLRMFSGRSVLIEGIPPDVRRGAEEKILQEMLEQYHDYAETLKIESRDNVAKSYACRSAIMAGDKLSQWEMSVLIDQLFATSMPYVCPHGRPIIIKLSLEELDRMFGRT
ncbi:MAG: DNA mismatch repair endonuclease MutL [Rhizobacter sp.]|nr:DNA mismatch repair endonuclease MutL [Chlorobiales bacterium]